ncbi:MAG TPA: GGDEF domain-containing protein [Candidatus Binatia bacterium]|nr:GGDEF domain-containing protein [Candidatus Binatia bacterium]
MTSRTLPELLIEDCLALLRTLVVAAWIGVALLLALEAWLRWAAPAVLPVLDFSTTYHGLLLEFSLNTIVLTALIVRRDWYERVPRRSLERMRWLLGAVLVWIGLHVFIAFHATGGLTGPMLPLLPVLVTASLLGLPERGGRWLATYVIAGHAAAVALEASNVLPHGPLAAAFAYAPPAPLGVATLALVMLAAIAVAMIAHLRFRQTGVALHHAGRLDHLTGLFHRDFLTERVEHELARVDRQHDAAVLLLARLQPLRDDVDSEARLAAMAQSLIGLVRTGSDTPARYGLGTLAVLLPASRAEGAGVVTERLRSGLARFDVQFGAAVIGSGTSVTAAQVYAAAERALAEGVPSHPV